MDKIQAALPTPAPLLIVVSGYSGVGKDSVIKRMRELGYPFDFVVTATSRPPRPGEVPGVDYQFITEAEFQEMVRQDGFLEHATVYGQSYGVPKAQVQRAMQSGHDVILRVDVQGAATIRELVPNALLIFLSTSSEAELIERLKARRTETPDALQKRIDTIERETEYVPLFDYVVINRHSKLDDAVAHIQAIITAEKLRVHPRVARI